MGFLPWPESVTGNTAEELQIVREMLDDAENAHNAGNDQDARRILREVIAALEEFAED